VSTQQPVQAEDPVQSLEFGAQGELKENQRSSQEPEDFTSGNQPRGSPAVFGNFPGKPPQGYGGRANENPGHQRQENYP
jgi:hypothetical protein